MTLVVTTGGEDDRIIGVGSYTPVRPALPFQFDIEPCNEDDATILRGRASVSNVLDPVTLPMPTSSVAFTLALLPPEEAEEIY